FPALTCLAATWNPDIAMLYGKSIGEEARYRGKDILLGPGVNIYRTPLNGRNFEYMGEDPYLASKMVVPYIKGVQSNGVAACVKHYALNNHEVNRHTTNVIIDDRTLHEIYLPAFKAAVKDGGTWSIMGSYNLYKDQHGCHNQYLLNDILKGEWGFDGVVVSDWGGTHDTAEAITNGLDMEFGSWTNGLSNGASNAYDNYYLANPYLSLIEQGKVGTKELDDKVRRILRLAFRTNMDRNRPYGSICSPEHIEAARTIGEEGIVLLKNSGKVLPINPKTVRRVAVVGENALKMMTVGGGSSSLKVKYELSPLDGIRHKFGPDVEVVYARGYVGDPTGEYNGVVTGQNLKDDRSADELIAEAVDVAANADCVIFVGGLNKSAHQDCEDSDRTALELPYGQDDVIRALARANRNLVVVNISGNAVAMPWVNDVPAILQAWYLGTESGNAIANVITGTVNPSGKLPMTFPVKLDDVGAHSLGLYPGTPRNDGSKIVDCKYDEGIFVGYRWADRNKVKPLFPFGHGLSYTDFKYGKAKVDKSSIGTSGKLTLTIPVTNTGDREGSEVVQLYISDLKSSLPRPVKELKGFKKVKLAPSETAEISFEIDRDALSYFDPSLHAWVCEPGSFEALVGTSSADIRSKVRFEVSDTLADNK
ncbi:glycoside hydrolase family 3 C-terminal domain-containing protein, partial [uncultured Duncaniella sp.]